MATRNKYVANDTCYKLVRSAPYCNPPYVSSFISQKQYMVRYRLNYAVRPKILGSYLFAFDNLPDAVRDYASYSSMWTDEWQYSESYAILKCEYDRNEATTIRVRAYYGQLRQHVEMFWNLHLDRITSDPATDPTMAYHNNSGIRIANVPPGTIGVSWLRPRSIIGVAFVPVYIGTSESVIDGSDPTISGRYVLWFDNLHMMSKYMHHRRIAPSEYSILAMHVPGLFHDVRIEQITSRLFAYESLVGETISVMQI